MRAEKQPSGEYAFVRSFDVEEGEYQYKFRLGPGDWWVCDEKKPTVDDGMGNRNNLVVAKPVQHVKQQARQISEGKIGAERSPSVAKHSRPASRVRTPTHDGAHESPLMQHEAFASHDLGSRSEQTPEHERSDPMESTPHEHKLLPHEALSPATHNEDDDAIEPYNAPLLRHESLSATSPEQQYSPLLRHESIGLASAQPASPTTQKLAGSPVRRSVRSGVQYEADPNDPTLERFPTSHEEIMKHIQRTHTRLPEDETHDSTTGGSPASSNAVSDASSSFSGIPALSSVQEADEQLEKIRHAEEEEVENEEKSGEELDPLKEGHALPTPPPEPEDADFEPKVPALKVVLVPSDGDDEIIVLGKKCGLVDKVGQKNLM